MHYPNYLKKGDKIAIIAPAKAIDQSFIDEAAALWRGMGYEVVIGENCLNQKKYFAGTTEERAADLQWAIDDPEVKAIICARGGYGCIQNIEKVKWEAFKNNPKWLIGFSDVTVYHFLLSSFGIASVHGTMPLNYKDNTKASIVLLNDLLLGELQNYSWESQSGNDGKASGELLGGNLAVISDLIGTVLQPEMKGKILFLEEVGEYHYTIDRMFYQLKYAGILNDISGLVIGSFSKVGDSKPPFGATVAEIIIKHCSSLEIPVAFNFPVGHQNDNRPLKCGGYFSFEVENNKAKLIEEIKR
jgi:muramoyltetrapeptide carboxypeptidase